MRKNKEISIELLKNANWSKSSEVVQLPTKKKERKEADH